MDVQLTNWDSQLARIIVPDDIQDLNEQCNQFYESMSAVERSVFADDVDQVNSLVWGDEIVPYASISLHNSFSTITNSVPEHTQSLGRSIWSIEKRK